MIKRTGESSVLQLVAQEGNNGTSNNEKRQVDGVRGEITVQIFM